MKKCKIDGCENQAVETGNLCVYHKLEKQSKRVAVFTQIKVGVMMVVPLVLGGIALLKGNKSFKK